MRGDHQILAHGKRQAEGIHMADYDIILQNGLIMDGSGNAPYPGEIGIRAG